MAGQNVRGEVAKQRSNDLATLIERQKPEIARALPRHMDADRLARIATTVMRRSPDLGQASAQSFLGALMTCAQLGLEPGPLQHAYLVPFWNKNTKTKDVVFILGYRGMLELARRSGQVRSVAAHVVRAGDHFDYALGLHPRLEHVPSIDAVGDLTHVYAVVHYKDGGHDFEVMTRAQVDKIRQRSQSPDKGPWASDYDEMARKTVLRRLAKRMPMSVEFQQADAADGSVRTDIERESLDVVPPDAETVDAELVDDGGQQQAPVDTETGEVADAEVVDEGQPPPADPPAVDQQGQQNGDQPSEGQQPLSEEEPKSTKKGGAGGRDQRGGGAAAG